MAAETSIQLSKIKNIVGIKEASGNLETLDAIRAGSSPHFLLSSGDDASCIEFILRGGQGVISVVSHIIPKSFSHLVARARAGEESVRSEYKKYSELNALMGIESNPIPVKMGLHLMGIIESPELRLPLVELSSEYKIKLAAELERLGVIK
jgi:4-hydroxy-tetrahydrodipicolinate synthase